MTKSRGVRGAAGGCAVASLVYLLARGLLTLLVSALMGLAHPGASLAKPLGFSGVSTALFQLLIGLGAIVLTLVFLLKVTRLKTKDLRIMLPAPWSPGFCLPVFLGVANLANLAGALINRLTGSPATSEMLPSGGSELLMQFLALCVMPAIAEELLFRGAFQGLMRPCGSAAAIFAPALLFGVLHLDLAQGLTAFACGVFLGWLAERSGSILPGMLLHLVNNALAFLTIYLRYYAPAEVSFGVELFILLFFPAFGAWMICNARRQGFSFSAGLHPGVDVLTVADALDAATDDIGRCYNRAKPLRTLVGELQAQSGTRYAPDVVALFRDKTFCEVLAQKLDAERKKVYLQAYHAAE